MSKLEGDYTPFGLLQNVDHCFPDKPSGVVKSFDVFRFGWLIAFKWFISPENADCVVSIGIAFNIDGDLFITQNDYLEKNVEVGSSYHTKNIIENHFTYKDIEISGVFILIDGDSLACSLTLRNSGNTARNVEVMSHATLCCRDTPLVVKEESSKVLVEGGGRSIALVCDKEFSKVMASQSIKSFRKTLLKSSNGVQYFGEATGWGILSIKLAPGEEQKLTVVVAKDSYSREVLRKAENALRKYGTVIEEKMREDRAFWRKTAFLIGDWPLYWLNGFRYDIETLRHMVYPPRGIIKNKWDIMHVNWPRVVLAETSIDMFIYSYFDENTAKEVLYGLFANAKAPNVPCIHADGTPNMIAYDGSACGTSPAWCFPFYDYHLIYIRTGDLKWVKKLYPYWKKYLFWWIENRSDEEGFLHYKCSWESGEDMAFRFGGGGEGSESIEYLRVSELQAVMSHAAKFMAIVARDLGLKEDEKTWIELHEEYLNKLEWHWNRNWYRDFDTRFNTYTRFKDALHLAPVFLELAPQNKVKIMFDDVEAVIREICVSAGWDVLWWPPLTYSLLEALAKVSEEDKSKLSYLRKIVFSIVDSAYKAADTRVLRPRYPVPGTSYEHWGYVKGEFAGIECYGWGALTSLMIIRYLLGMREDLSTKSLKLMPNLPEKFLGRYGIRGINYRGVVLDIVYRKTKRKLNLKLRIKPKAPLGEKIVVENEEAGVVLEKNLLKPFAETVIVPNETVTKIFIK